MAGDFFLWAVTGATAAAAIALLAVLFRRPRPARVPPARLTSATAATADAATEETTGHDAADPAWGDPRADEEPDLAKICPACGLRYGLESRTCARDNSELAAIN